MQSGVKHWRTTVVILAALSASPILAEDFKTIDGREYKNAAISRVEPDGIVLKTKSGVAKIYFTELPKEVQERFHYNPAQAAAAQAAAVRQAQEINESNKQQEELAKQQGRASQEQQARSTQLQAKSNNTQALADQLSILQHQEQNSLVQIGQAEKRKEEAWRRWVDGRGGQYDTSAEAELPVLRGNLDNVREEKKRVSQEVEGAQR
jgi:hypothetical protein